MLKQHLKNSYDLAFEIRYRSHLPSKLQWIREIIRFVQLLFFYLDFCPVREINTRSLTFLRALNNARLVNSCFSFSVIPIHSNFVLLITQSLLYYYFKKLSDKAKNGKYVSKNSLFLITSSFEFLLPCLQMQMFFRFSQLLILVYDSFSLLSILSLIIHIFNLLFCSYIDYISSIFFRPRIFIKKTLVDYNSCCTEYYIFWLRFCSVTFQVILAESHNNTINTLLFLAYPTVLTLLLIYRLSIGIHTTVILAFFNDAILFTQPFVLMSHLYKEKFNPAIVLFSFLIIYVFIYYIYHYSIKRRIYNGETEFPWYLPVRNSLVMRYLSEEKADIEKFENLMLLRMKHDDEEMMEVVRFLGIFKNQRQKILIMLSMWKGESIYYDYQFYLAGRVFRCYTDNCPEYYINELDNLHRNYLVCLSMFWKYRHEHHHFTSFLYGTKASLTHVEMINFIEYLAYIYRCDPNIYQSYAEISLIALGEPSKSVIYRRHSQFLKDNHYNVVDPIFKATARYYPISIEQYTEEKSSTDSSETNSTSSSSSILSPQHSYNHIRFHFSDNVIYRDEDSDNSSIAMFVEKSVQMKSMNVFVSVFLIFVWSYYFSRDVTKSEMNNSQRLILIKDIIKKTMQLNLEVTSFAMVRPIIESKRYINCFDLKIDIYRYLNRHSFSVGDDFTFTSKSLSFMSDFLSKSSIENCHELEIDNYKIISDRLNMIQNNFYVFETKVNEILNRNDLLTIYHKYAFYLLIMSIIISIFSAFMGYMSVRFPLSDLPEKALSFLGSKERLSMLLLKKSLESWDFFRILFPFENQIQNNKTQKSTDPNNKISLIRSRKHSVSKYGSDTNINNHMNQQTNIQRHNIIPKGNTKSRHVNLKESKIAISFIGSDESLKASQFALMRNIVQTNSDNNFYSPLTSSDVSDDCSSASGSTSNITDDITADTVEDRDIVKETIEKTKISDIRVLILIFSTHIIPWIIILLIVAYSNHILNFQIRCENIFVESIRPNITDLHQLPLRIYGYYLNKSNNNQQNNFKYFETNMTSNYFTYFDEYFHSKNRIYETDFEIKEMKINSNISFYSHRLEHFIEDTERANSISMTSLVSFCIVSAFIWFSTNAAVYKIESFIIRGFNSLFHFPHSYLDIINKPLDTSRHSSVPSNCIEIIVDNDTKVISDISENTYEIIGLFSIDLIGRKYDDIFTREEKDIISFSFNHKKSKKFIEDKIEDELITRIALIPTKTDDLHDINSSHQNLSTILNSIFLHHDYIDCFVVLFLFDSCVFNSCVDHIFFATHNILQLYSCCKLLNIEGSLVYFSIEDSDTNVVYLFIRDMINSSTPTTRNSLKTTTQSTESSSITSVVFCRTSVHIGISVAQEFDKKAVIQDVPFASVSFHENDVIRKEIFGLRDKSILFYDENDDHKNIISFDDLNVILENEN